jgi:hypothetical protein
MFFQVIGLRQWLALGAGFVLLAALVWQAFYFMGKGKAEAEAKLRPQIVKLEREANVEALDGKLKLQNAEVERVKREGEAKRRAAEAAYAKAEKGRQAAEVKARKLLARPVTGDVCKDVLAVDRMVLEALK